MKKYISKSLIAMCAAAALGTTGCIEEKFPTTLATPEQIETDAKSLEYMINGLSDFFLDYNTYGTTVYLDWGFPCQMYMREIQGEDFPIYSSTWNYWTFLEAGTGLTYGYYYTFYYYYSFIHNANNVIEIVDPEDASDTQLNYLGAAYGYRAFCYLDLMRCYEYKATGVDYLDAEAEADGVYGLAVPIVTEKTTIQESQNNPRATVYALNRFIMTDLNKAEKYIEGYARPATSFMDQSVIYALKAELWLDMASRFDFDSEELAKQVALEGSDDGYDDLGIHSAAECYAKAQEYARLAQAGYTPLTRDQWLNADSGFNNSDTQNSWMLSTKCTTIEQFSSKYYNFQGQICSEATWGLPQYGSAFRCISSKLYNQIPDGDWRKLSWIAPTDANTLPLPDKYATNTRTVSSVKALPAYANIKFKPAGGVSGITDYTVGVLADLPILRVEAMKFIEIEAMAHTQSVAAAADALQTFINTYRYTDGTYTCPANDYDAFMDALMLQRRIEFWGEGVNYFDYKRLHRTVTRSGSNYLSNFNLNSYDGYVAPWMNYVLPEGEQDQNSAIISLNPDPSGAISAE